MKNYSTLYERPQVQKMKGEKVMELGSFGHLVKFLKYAQKFNSFMINFECPFELKSKSWQHESCRLKFSLYFSFKNNLKWLSVEKDMMIRILS